MSPLPGCHDISRRLSEARDSGRRLSAGERLHLWVCVVCRRLRDQFDLLGRAAAAPPQAGPSLSAEAKARLKKLLGAGG